ncbi:enoyl-CoA hydratase-related protein [Myxococcota bacterium]|nr:enoyl-CoA hydratase-related protein [Myxococcota bacterium]
MAFSSDVLTLERSGPVATLWLDRPEKRNAMSQPMWTGIGEAMRELSQDSDIRAVVIAGRGKSFCVGIDVSALSGGLGARGEGERISAATANLRQLEVTRTFQAAFTAVAECPVPVIAAIHSHCIGGGMDLVTACDIRLASADAIFGVRETRIGIVADVGTLQRLPGVVTTGHVAELAYTGRDIDAARAEKIGLVNDVYPDVEAVQAAAHELALEIAANSPLAVRGTKFILRQGEDLTTEQSLLINGLWTLVTSLGSDDLKEAMKAMLEKRVPRFTGT